MHGYRAQRAFDGRRALPGRALVLVEGGTIGATTLLPGLIDTHVHLCADGGPRALDQLGELDADAIDAIVATSLRQHLAAGVTAVRDLGGSNWAVVDRHRGPGAGPTVVAAGPPITAVQGALLVAGWPGRRYRTAARGGPRLAVTAHAPLLAAVELCAAAGVDGIEHCSCLTDRGFATPPALATRLAEAGTDVCPTLGRAPGVQPTPQMLAMMAAPG